MVLEQVGERYSLPRCYCEVACGYPPYIGTDLTVPASVLCISIHRNHTKRERSQADESGRAAARSSKEKRGTRKVSTWLKSRLLEGSLAAIERLYWIYCQIQCI